MTGRTLALIAIALWLVMGAALVYVLGRSYSTPASDGRVALELTAAEREFVLGQMRGMLSTVQGIADGLANGNREQVVAAARASGEAGMVVQPLLMAKFPAPFKALSTQLHSGFDALATAAESNASSDDSLRLLSAQLATCVGCHAAYRLSATGTP